jgi:hypothetical protein
MDARLGAELSTKYKGGHGMKEEPTNGHFSALDAISERVALKYIAASLCFDVTDLDEPSWKVRSAVNQGGRLLSHANKETRKQYVEQWEWDLGSQTGGKRSQVKLGYPLEVDHQVCSNIPKTDNGVLTKQ